MIKVPLANFYEWNKFASCFDKPHLLIIFIKNSAHLGNYMRHYNTCMYCFEGRL